jgi:hypothetical protein
MKFMPSPFQAGDDDEGRSGALRRAFMMQTLIRCSPGCARHQLSDLDAGSIVNAALAALSPR